MPLLRQEIAGLYEGVCADGVLLGAPQVAVSDLAACALEKNVECMSQELILLGLSAMLSPGDHAVRLCAESV